MPPTLNGTDVSGKHQYLAKAKPDWTNAMFTLQRMGGPWPCAACNTASLLPYRCSACGHDLTGD